MRNYNLAEWTKIIALLLGVGASPLFAHLSTVPNMRWVSDWYWILGIAAGMILLGVGFYYWFNAFQHSRARLRISTKEELAKVDFRERFLLVETEPDRAVFDPKNLGKRLADLFNLARAGQISANELDKTLRLQSSLTLEPGEPSLPLEALRSLHKRRAAGLISEPAFREQLNRIISSTPKEIETQAGDIRQAMVLIPLGVFILLPALAGWIMQNNELENAPMVTAFLTSPVLAIWATFETVALLPHWFSRTTSRQISRLGVLRSGLQVLSAFLIWLYLGLAFQSPWMTFLFLLGAAAGIGGAVAGSRLSALEESIHESLEQANLPSDKPSNPPSQSESPTAIISSVNPPVSRLARFRIFLREDQQFYFHLLVETNDVILASAGFRTISACKSCIGVVRRNAALPERYERLKSSDGNYYFVLKSANHRVIGKSDSFANKITREIWIKAVQQYARTALIDLSEIKAGEKQNGSG